MTALPRVAVFVLNWNGRAFLEPCLTALLGQTRPPARLVVIDNGSTDGSEAFVRERFPSVGLVQNHRNLGFAAGNNVVLRGAEADIIALVNPDVVASPDWLAELARGLEADPRIGIIGSKLWYPDGVSLQHAGGFITAPQAMPGHFGINEPDDGQHDAPRDVEYVIGGAIAIRREVLQTVGLLDEGFFLYFEDVDFCYRARRAGYRVVYWPGAAAVHVESATAVKGSFSYLQRFHIGRWRFLLKHFEPDFIVEQTLPAERGWLARLPLIERQAAALAYSACLSTWDDILAARLRDGAPPFDATTVEAIRVGLSDMRAGVWQSWPVAHDLPVAPELQGRPFKSAVPVLGPLIAAARSTWNRLTASQVVDGLAEQQSLFNAETLSRLDATSTATAQTVAPLVSGLERQLRLERDQRQAGAEVEQMRRQLAEARERLIAIERRLDRRRQGDQR